MSDVPELTQRVSAALGRMGSTSTVAEFHGTLIGLLCAKGALEKNEWLAQVAQPEAAQLSQEEQDSLAQMHGEAVRQLNDPVMEFQPLLPQDSEPLETRVEALAEWCQGFLLGLSEGGMKAPDKMGGDAGEVLRDLVNISRAGTYELSDSEEDEEAYTELLEYVRTGVLLINEELNPTRAAPRGDATVH